MLGRDPLGVRASSATGGAGRAAGSDRSVSTRACRTPCTATCAAVAAGSAAGTDVPTSSAGKHSSAVAMSASVNRLSAACRPRSIRLQVACEMPARLAA